MYVWSCVYGTVSLNWYAMQILHDLWKHRDFFFFSSVLVRMLAWEFQEHSVETVPASSVMCTLSLYAWLLVPALTIMSHLKRVVNHCEFIIDILCCHKYYTEYAFVVAVHGHRIWCFLFNCFCELRNAILFQNYSTVHSFIGSLKGSHWI
jgi:hypothetical protein